MNLKLNSNVVIIGFSAVLESLMEPGTIAEQPVLKEITSRLKDVILKLDSLVRLSNASDGIVIKTYGADCGTQTVINHLRTRLKEPIVLGDSHLNLSEKVTFDFYSISEGNSKTYVSEVKKRWKLN